MQARLLFVVFIALWAIHGGLAEAQGPPQVVRDVTASSPLASSGGTTPNISLPGITMVQQRVTGTCPAGSSIRVINTNGTVVCEVDDVGVTTVTASAPLVSSGGPTPDISLPNVIIDISNTAIGDGALQRNTAGANNTASGVDALGSNTTGANNTASGHNALGNNTTGVANTASGDTSLFSNTIGTGNTASGSVALGNNTTGNGNTASGSNALQSNTTGSFNTAVGNGADVAFNNLTNATAIGSGAIVDASDKIRLGNTAVTVIEGQVGFTAASDKNQKENFQPVDGEKVLTKIRGLTLSTWNFMGHDPKRFRHYGPVGQEFFAAFGHDGVGTIGTPTTITSTDMEGVLMVAVQTLEKRTAVFQQEIELLKETVEALKAENAELRARFEAGEKLTSAKETLARK